MHIAALLLAVAWQAGSPPPVIALPIDPPPPVPTQRVPLPPTATSQVARPAAPKIIIPASQEREELDRVSRRIDRFQASVFMGVERLWSGELSVNRFAPASYTEGRNGAAAPSCPEPGRNISSGRELNVRIHKYGGNVSDPDHYSFTAGVRRTVPSTDCKSTANHAVSLEERANVGPGQQLELRGEGGLRLVVRRLRPLEQHP